jgi:NitT/TauT family transport system ATP-binding protein
MVSHDIREVAYMADRTVVLGANPGVVRTVVENRLPRPRDYRSAELGRLIDQLHEIITGSEMPDVPEPPATAEPTPLEPLPYATPIEIVGLMEYLDARGGSDDLFRIVTDTQREFGHVISVVKAAEMLEFVDTPKRLVILTPDGQRFRKADSLARKAIWKEQLLKLRLFTDIASVMARQPRHEVDRDFVLDMLALGLPEENLERLFETIVAWARFGELLEYDDARERLAAPS